MGQFKRYTKPPVGEAVGAMLNSMIPGDDRDYYRGDGMMGDDLMMGGGLPPPSYYGQPQQQWNAEMMDRLIDTGVDEFDQEGNVLARPKLWLFESKAFRHFQLSNLRSRDQTEIERSIADIQMLSHQDGNEDICNEMQVRVYSQLCMFKSRSDLPIQHRERDAWFTNVSEMKTQEIRRPQGSGGFFSDLMNKRSRRDY